MAVLSSDSLDATTIDPATVRFGVTVTEAAVAHHAIEDVNQDGRPDLIVHFATQSTGIVPGTDQVTLTGLTTTGRAITGMAAIRTVPF